MCEWPIDNSDWQLIGVLVNLWGDVPIITVRIRSKCAGSLSPRQQALASVDNRGGGNTSHQALRWQRHFKVLIDLSCDNFHQPDNNRVDIYRISDVINRKDADIQDDRHRWNLWQIKWENLKQKPVQIPIYPTWTTIMI